MIDCPPVTWMGTNSFDVAACVNEGGPASKQQNKTPIKVWLNEQEIPVSSLETYAKLCATIGGEI